MVRDRREVQGDDERILGRNLWCHPRPTGSDRQSAHPKMRSLQHLCAQDGHVLQAQAVGHYIAKFALNAHLDCPLEAAPRNRRRGATISNWPPWATVSDWANARLPKSAAIDPPIPAPMITHSNEMPSACSWPKRRSVNTPTTTGPTPTPINVTTATKSATIKPWNLS